MLNILKFNKTVAVQHFSWQASISAIGRHEIRRTITHTTYIRVEDAKYSITRHSRLDLLLFIPFSGPATRDKLHCQETQPCSSVLAHYAEDSARCLPVSENRSAITLSLCRRTTGQFDSAYTSNIALHYESSGLLSAYRKVMVFICTCRLIL